MNDDDQHTGTAYQAKGHPEAGKGMIAGLRQFLHHIQGEDGAFGGFSVFAGDHALIAIAVIFQCGGAGKVFGAAFTLLLPAFAVIIIDIPLIGYRIFCRETCNYA